MAGSGHDEILLVGLTVLSFPLQRHDNVIRAAVRMESVHLIDQLFSLFLRSARHRGRGIAYNILNILVLFFSTFLSGIICECAFARLQRAFVRDMVVFSRRIDICILAIANGSFIDQFNPAILVGPPTQDSSFRIFI